MTDRRVMTRRESALGDVPASSPEITKRRELKLLHGAAAGFVLFLLHQAAVVSGALAPPPGYEPSWGVRSLDLPQYVTWVAASRTSFLMPDFHAPWVTEPALFQPLFALAGWLPFSSLAAYQILSALLYMAAGMALIFALRVFCPEHPRYALVASACAIPLGLLLLNASKIFRPVLLFGLGLAGIVDYTYNSADGLFRGGLAASATLSAGTAFVLAFMAVLAVYVKRGEPRYAWILGAIAFFSAFLHPFEIYVMVAASALPLWQRGLIRTWLGIVGAGALGIAPYVLASTRSEWLRDVGERIRYPMYPFWIPQNYGIPFLLLVYLLLIRFRMPRAEDKILQNWFVATMALAFVPGISFPSHLFNGFAYCVGFLLVQRLGSDAQLLSLIKRHRHVAKSLLASLIVLTGISMFLVYRQLWKDGRRAEPEWFLSAVRPASERDLFQWLQLHANPGSLVLSPPELAPWIAAIPRTSFASHDFFSITYTQQSKLSQAFYRGEDMQDDLLDAYGVRFAVVPAASRAIAHLPAEAFRESIGPWRIYEFPKAQMKPYPGLAALDPTLQTSPRTRLLTWLAHLRRSN